MLNFCETKNFHPKDSGDILRQNFLLKISHFTNFTIFTKYLIIFYHNSMLALDRRMRLTHLIV